jgi:signal transduction histidine kinase
MATGAPGTTQKVLTMAQAVDDCLKAAILLVDSRRRIAFTAGNASLLARLALSPESSIDLLPEPLHDLIDAALQSSLSPGDRGMVIELEGADAAPIHAQALLQNGNVLLLLNDLAPVRKFESDALRHVRLASIGSLSASMAHEIKNALTAVKIFLELLVKEHEGEPALGDLVLREFRRIDTIVTQMLRISDRTRPAFSPLSIHSSLEHALRLIEHQLAGKQVRLVRVFSASSDMIHGDGFQIEQAFLNLLLNALDALDQSGQLTITTENDLSSSLHPGLLVSITDTGCGIVPENLERLFEPFFTTKPNGTGLGLSITQRIVEEHRGSIRVETKPAQGSTFRIVLPLLDGAAQS